MTHHRLILISALILVGGVYAYVHIYQSGRGKNRWYRIVFAFVAILIGGAALLLSGIYELGLAGWYCLRDLFLRGKPKKSAA